ncbi:hypothetical protein FJT64_025765 [Amphibalanus amphitrite]|uniref:Uncharacterized protein n=1 Tax=Amphibalanus amphitrite TaxID=1232801 RepID=A0A6A4WE89_AMPAM|nr:hypothetical protein FJT64_025765 [Amphibalanus amphitrite]
MRQCRRLAKLGGVTDDKLCEIVAARCKGLALEVVNAIEDFDGPLSLDKIQKALTARFEGGATTAQQAAEALSSLVKGADTAADYGLKVQQLVRKACPEFFGDDGQVKKICVPAHGVALYRHFLIGISDQEKRLLSRLKANTFEACVSELTREEALPADQASEAVTFAARQVRWSSPDREPGAGRSGGSGCRRDVVGYLQPLDGAGVTESVAFSDEDEHEINAVSSSDNQFLGLSSEEVLDKFNVGSS